MRPTRSLALALVAMATAVFIGVGVPVGSPEPPPAVPVALEAEAPSADALGGDSSGMPGPGSVGCIGDGISGSRVQALYAVPADLTDQSSTVVPAIRATYAPRIEWQFSQSAAETGGEAHVIFVTEPDPGGGGCQLSVPIVHLSSAGDDTFAATMSELKALGYNRPDRKYLVWADSPVLCGVANFHPDARPGPENLNNASEAMYARVDTACWGVGEGHELMHTLGAVQPGAPHEAGVHCWDELDNMCYDYDTGHGSPVTVCPGRSNDLFDCNHDDYFYAGVPPPSNWLSTHWNTWNSNWLHRAPLTVLATVPPPITGTTTGTDPEPPLIPSPPQVPQASGYWMLTADGHVHPFGAASFLGQPYPLAVGVRAVHLEPTPTGNGYWVLDDTGRVQTYGDADPLGYVPVGGLARGERAVSLSATPTGDGYWVFTSRGRVVRFGDAGFFGDVATVALNRPVIGSIATPSGKGYYLFAADGGIFTFGDAAFFGSTGGMRLNQPIVGMATTQSGKGYWLTAADGGLFAFGAAGFHGSMGAVKLNRPISAVVPGQAGYLMVAQDGGAFAFGDVRFFGSLGNRPPATPVISVALRS